ncbi:2Fe-2S iron-sulfur cluster-binding protein [Ramlibacter sp.]|uniref:2Fe-2S iron-sulfur cluster-binding protein n=1 Tax=Ramlibacter sp. TaxID=1917967 RepID=UPI0017A4B50B|nr:2Fe-2S iron-sulfur cluster-binding protein [Ramlibacter sp.]MBA2673016.1 2Fe-2S iron-sulfur cluster binding domain-containing protein [Ramlibacter sp.]
MNDAPAEPATVFEATLARSGQRFAAPADQPLLVSAEAAGIALPSSCRNGTCRTCISRLAQGEVRYRIAWPGLLPEEKQAGWILPCVAYPVTDVVVEAQDLFEAP